MLLYPFPIMLLHPYYAVQEGIIIKIYARMSTYLLCDTIHEAYNTGVGKQIKIEKYYMVLI